MPSEGEKSPEAENNNKNKKTGASQVKCLKKWRKTREREGGRWQTLLTCISRWDGFLSKFRGS